MNIPFKVLETDNSVVTKFKTEANIKLASVIKLHGFDSKKYTNENYKLSKLLNVIIVLSDYNEISEFIINDLNQFAKTNLLSPLTLEDDEFKYSENDAISEWYENTRCSWIERKDTSGLGITNKVYTNFKAFNMIFKAEYNHIENKQTELGNYIGNFCPHVYITKGGVVTEDYINKCYINIDNKPYDYLTTPIILPISIIRNGETMLYTVEHREPKLKELMTLYNVELGVNNDIKGKYDIRKYNKLNK